MRVLKQGQDLISQKQLHVLLREALVQKIASGEWRTGQLIPNEVDLAQTYQLSQGTVRKALEWMEQARLVIRKQGRGTFVLDRSGDDITERYVRVRTALGQVPKADIEVQHTAVGEATPEECGALELKPGSFVRRIARLYSIDSRPMAWGTASIPATWFNLTDAEVKSLVTLPKLAARCGVLLGEGEERLRQSPATAQVASALRCEAGALVFASEVLTRAVSGAPAEWRRSFRKLPEGYYYSVPIGVTAAYE